MAWCAGELVVGLVAGGGLVGSMDTEGRLVDGLVDKLFSTAAYSQYFESSLGHWSAALCSKSKCSLKDRSSPVAE